MAKCFCIFKRRRNISGLTFYMWEGQQFVRKKSSLTRKKVLTSPKFARTREYAGLMARASKIGSAVYHVLPEYWRQLWMYRAFTGEAMQLLQAGRSDEEIQEALLKIYVEEVGSKMYEAGSMKLENGGRKSERRAYRKRDTTYWNNKTAKANKRKARAALTLYYAGMLAKASRVGSAVYKCLPVSEQTYPWYKALTGMAMEMLKEDVCEDEVKRILMKYAGRDEVISKSSVPMSIESYQDEVRSQDNKEVPQADMKTIKGKVIRNDGRHLYYISSNTGKRNSPSLMQRLYPSVRIAHQRQFCHIDK